MGAVEKPKRNSIVIPLLLCLAAIAGLVPGLLGVGGLSLSWHKLDEKLLWPIIRVICYLSAGLVIGLVIEGTGWAARLAAWVRPITVWGHLKPESGTAFVSSFASGIVANTMLMGSHQDGRLSRKELILTYLVNNGLPLFLVHLPTTLVIVGSLAREAGIVYLCITFAAACLRTIVALAVSRMSLSRPDETHAAPHSFPAGRASASRSSIPAVFRSRVIRLIAYTIPIYVLVFLVNEWGFFVWLRLALARWVSLEFFPIEAASVIIMAVAAEFSSGFAAAGALMDAGALSVKQTAVALIAGTIVATPIRAIRHQLPTHAGIFSLGLATYLLLVSQTLRIVSLVVVTVPYVIWG